jgi:uncharacterized protein YndB with AHSA1/START domain
LSISKEEIFSNFTLDQDHYWQVIFKINIHKYEGETYSHTGEYKEASPTDKIIFCWNSYSGYQYSNTLVTITLSEVGGGTEVKLMHEFMPNDQQVENHIGVGPLYLND